MVSPIPGNTILEKHLPIWLLDWIELIFSIKKRNTTIELELYSGIIQFISCLYVLPVIPYQMKTIGYNETYTSIATSAICCIGCILSAFLTNMPLIIAPPTSISIYFIISMQQSNLSLKNGNIILIITGCVLTLLGFISSIINIITKIIPNNLQISITIGIGLLTAFAGVLEINLIVKGQYTILEMGPITIEIIIALSNLILITILLHYSTRSAFCIGLIYGTLMYWTLTNSFPDELVGIPKTINSLGEIDSSNIYEIVIITCNLLLLFILTLNSLTKTLCDLAHLTTKSGSIPRGNLLYIVCGLSTILSGYFSGPPVLISPETAAGIKAGAKTGLSTLICGIFFGFATFFGPLFASVPSAGTAPLLIMIGVIMFSNTKKINWNQFKISIPCFCVLFFIPFSYNILQGIVIGYIIYFIIFLFTSDYFMNVLIVKDRFVSKINDKLYTYLSILFFYIYKVLSVIFHFFSLIFSFIFSIFKKIFFRSYHEHSRLTENDIEDQMYHLKILNRLHENGDNNIAGDRNDTVNTTTNLMNASLSSSDSIEEITPPLSTTSSPSINKGQFSATLPSLLISSNSFHSTFTPNYSPSFSVSSSNTPNPLGNSNDSIESEGRVRETFKKLGKFLDKQEMADICTTKIDQL